MHTGARNIDPEDEAFARQCAEAGLLVCRHGADGWFLPWDATGEILTSWASALTKLLPGGGDDRGESEIYPGSHFLRSAHAPDWAQIVLTPTALAGTQFSTICAAGGLAPEVAADALTPFLKYSVSQQRQATVTFDRLLSAASSSRQDQEMIQQFGIELSHAYEELNLFFRMARMLDTSRDPAGVVGGICDELHKNLAFGWVAASFFDTQVKIPALRSRSFSAGAFPATPEALRQTLHELFQKSTDGWAKIHNPPDSALARLADGQVIAELLTDRGHAIGVFLAGGKQGPDAEVTSGELQLIESAANLVSIFAENLARLTEQKSLFIGTVRSLAASIDAKDRYTRGHSERVATLAAGMARTLGMSPEEVEQYRVTGLLHDIGKIGVPEAILTKTDRLTNEEFQQIMRHPRIGYEILKDIPGLSFALPGVLHHHEKYDGTGYPDRLAGEQIPLVARVLALADTFDAMRSNRAYRTARTHETVIGEILRCAGTQFDSTLAQVFVGMNFAEFDRLLALDAPQTLAA